MISHPTLPDCEIRPPWPDEWPRLNDAFPRSRVTETLQPLVLVTRGAPERLVGFAGVFSPVADVARFTLALRPRFVSSVHAGGLIAAAARIAERAGARRLITCDNFRPDDSHVMVLERNGFGRQPVEFWSVQLAGILTHLARIETRLSRVTRSLALVIEPLAATGLPAVRELIAARQLLPGLEIVLASADRARGFESDLSFTVRIGAVLCGALLARRGAGDVVHIAAEAVAPPPGIRSARVHQALLFATLTAAQNIGGRRLVFPLEPATPRDIRRLAIRHGGQKDGETIRFARPLTSSL
jgi:hypothetical protein